MINVSIDANQIDRIARELLQQRINEIELQTVYWDTKELMNQTRLSWNTILEAFFYDERFPKFRIGRKWVYPAKETREFLIQWLREQPSR